MCRNFANVDVRLRALVCWPIKSALIFLDQAGLLLIMYLQFNQQACSYIVAKITKKRFFYRTALTAERNLLCWPSLRRQYWSVDIYATELNKRRFCCIWRDLIMTNHVSPFSVVIPQYDNVMSTISSDISNETVSHASHVTMTTDAAVIRHFTSGDDKFDLA